jgi:assimilatory nitrate reductase catalytic subunit/cobaltochelatase CobN
MMGIKGTPLWPAGHLPHKGGDQLGAPFSPTKSHGEGAELVTGFDLAKVTPLVISLLVGEMPGRAEGGMQRSPPQKGRTLPAGTPI